MSGSAETPITAYRDFWPYYLREHANPRTRAIHFCGTGLAVLSLFAALVTLEPWLLPVALLGGYGPAWYAHFFVEKNRPATFRFPLWSLVSDFRMAGLWALGRLSPELEKAGILTRRTLC
jgi:hypothetical protein